LAQLPRISRPLLAWFTWYSRGYVAKHFHSLRLSVTGQSPETLTGPLVIYSNHASWWDPLVCIILKSELFPERNAFAPIDAAMLQKYKMFARLGFYAVNQNSGRGARQFLRTSEAILADPQNLIAVTPQARFADCRERPLQFEPGLGHLAARTKSATFVPLAVEYVFWEERLPEILVRFGEPLRVNSSLQPASTATELTALFEQRLANTQDALAAEVKRRHPADFTVLLRGGAGQGGVYDLWRSVRARLSGQVFRKEHGTL
jgi:1-acyl-sn-glycerol-3-phosphate acyltransferase